MTTYVATNHTTIDRPDFIAPVYAGVGELADRPAPDGPMPMFLVAATNDQLGLARDSIALYEKWRGAGKSVELHMYAKGGHGFGMREQGLPSDTWIERFGDWMANQGL